MAKRNKNKRIAITIIIIVSVIALIFLAAIGFDFKNLAVGSSGYTTLSISNVQVIDSGARIRIYGVANGAEAIQINFNPAEINQYINDDGYEATKSVIGSIGLINPTREFYAIKDTSKNFYRLSYLDLGILKSCDNNAPSGTISAGRIATSTCLYYSSLGTYSSFTGQTLDNAPVNVAIGSSTGTLNPSSGNNVLVLNDGKTKIEWVGNLVNYQGLNNPNYALLFSSSQYNKLIDTGSYNSQQTALNTFTDCLGSSRIALSQLGAIGNLISVFKSDSVARGCINNFNNQINSYLVDRTQTYINSVNIDDAEFTNNGLKVDLTTPTIFPTFIITLDASDVGIIELSGKPQIVSCVSDKIINSGDTYSTNVRVRNTGESDASFYGQITCSGYSGASGIISEQYVSAGSTVNMPVQISGINTNSGTQSNNCQIKIIDRKSGDYDTCNFDLDVNYQQNIVCSPNSVTCLNSNTLRMCSSDGTSFETKTCDYGCVVLESGEAQCRTTQCIIDSDCKSGEECKLGYCVEKEITFWDKIKNFFSNIFGGGIFNILRWIFVLVVFIFGTLFSKDIFSSFEAIEENVWLGWVLGLVIGVLAGWLAWKIFWLGIVALIVFIVIKFFTGKFRR